MKPPADRTEMPCSHVEPSSPDAHPRVIDGPNGPVMAVTGTSVSDEDVRAELESTRERR